MKRFTTLLAIVPLFALPSMLLAQAGPSLVPAGAAPAIQVEPEAELIAPRIAQTPSAPLADPHYNHGIPWGHPCCEGPKPCADMLWADYCATQTPWCMREKRCHRGGCCPPMPAAMHWDAPGCESSAGSLPCCGHTLDRLHVAPGCGACGSCDSCASCAPHGGLFGGLFGSLRSSLGCPKCASGCCETCAPATCDTCGAVPTAAPASDYYHQAPAVQPLPPAVPAPADEDLGVPPVVNESARLPGYLRGY